LLSFPDMTTGRTTDGLTLSSIAYLALKADQQKVNEHRYKVTTIRCPKNRQP